MINSVGHAISPRLRCSELSLLPYWTGHHGPEFWWEGVVSIHSLLQTSFTDSVPKPLALPSQTLVYRVGIEPTTSKTSPLRSTPELPIRYSYFSKK